MATEDFFLTALAAITSYFQVGPIKWIIFSGILGVAFYLNLYYKEDYRHQFVAKIAKNFIEIFLYGSILLVIIILFTIGITPIFTFFVASTPDELKSNQTAFNYILYFIVAVISTFLIIRQIKEKDTEQRKGKWNSLLKILVDCCIYFSILETSLGIALLIHALSGDQIQGFFGVLMIYANFSLFLSIFLLGLFYEICLGNILTKININKFLDKIDKDKILKIYMILGIIFIIIFYFMLPIFILPETNNLLYERTSLEINAIPTNNGASNILEQTILVKHQDDFNVIFHWVNYAFLYYNPNYIDESFKYLFEDKSKLFHEVNCNKDSINELRNNLKNNNYDEYYLIKNVDTLKFQTIGPDFFILNNDKQICFMSGLANSTMKMHHEFTEKFTNKDYNFGPIFNYIKTSDCKLRVTYEKRSNYTTTTHLILSGISDKNVECTSDSSSGFAICSLVNVKENSMVDFILYPEAENIGGFNVKIC